MVYAWQAAKEEEMFKRLVILAAIGVASCSHPETASLTTNGAGNHDMQAHRYVITVAQDETGAVPSQRIEAVVQALQSHNAESVEALEGLPTIIVTARPDAIRAAEETGFVLVVQADGLSAPQ